MRVTKKDGKFVVDNEPMRLTGKAAKGFAAALEKCDGSPKHDQFLAECELAYRTHRNERAKWPIDVCPDCDGYRHGKVGGWWALFKNRGWCLRCCHGDGSPKPFELTDQERRDADGAA